MTITNNVPLQAPTHSSFTSRLGRTTLTDAIRNGVPEPEELEQDILIKGAAHQLFTGPGEGKTWVALWLIKRAIQREQTAMYFDQENGKRIVTERLQLLGVGENVDTHLYYYDFPAMGIDSKDTALYREELDAVEPDLLVFDSWVGFLGACGLEENSNTDVEEWSNAYITPAKARDCAVVILDHVPHDANRSRGATRKKDFVDVQWSLKKVQDFSRSNVGYIQLKLHKDRESWLPKNVGFSIGGTPEGFVMERSEGTVSDLPGKLPESAQRALDALDNFGELGATYKEWLDSIEWKGGKMPDSTFRTKAIPKLKEAESIEHQGDRYYTTAQHLNSTAA
jgi:hypothetical protein